MNRFASIFLAAAVLCISVPAIAHEGHHMPGEKAVTKTITGEVVDMGCWLGHAARGADHISCATKCLNNGMPMGLLTKEGKLYLLTMNHDSPDPYNQCKDWVSQTVEVSGTMATRAGVSAIDVQGAKPAAATK